MPAAKEDAVVVINVDKEAEGNDVGIHPGKDEAGVTIPQVNSHHHEVSLVDGAGLEVESRRGHRTTWVHQGGAGFIAREGT
jgi:hypothetical protein